MIVRSVTTIVAGWILALLGGLFAIMGAQLALLGGSWYYLFAGIAMIVSGAMIGRGRASGRWLFSGVWLATLIWAVWEVGLDPLQLMPRIVAPTVLLVLLYLPWISRGLCVDRRLLTPARTGAAIATVAIAVVGLTFVHASPTVAKDGSAVAPITAATPNNGDWSVYGGTLAGQRYSSVADITPANVTRLQQAWIQRTGDLPDPAEAVTHKREYHSESTPIHVENRLYTCTPHSVVQAIDATTGRTLWSWRETADRKGNSYLVCRGVAYYAAAVGTPCPRRIFAPTFNARMMALDADTGKPCAGFGHEGSIDLRDGMGASPAAMQISTSPPVVAGNRLIVGERIRDNVAVDEPSGVIRAFDPITGALVWAWDVGRSPDAIKALPKGELYTRGTPNVWGVMTADEKIGLIYLPLGNATPDYWIGKRRAFDDKFGSSLTALDIATGKLRWTFQLVHHDMWDMDLPVGPSLVDLPKPGGGTIPALVQTTKEGQIFVLNRLTGQPIMRVEERPVPIRGAMKDEPLSPTQPFSTGVHSFTPPPLREVDTWGATPIDQLVCRIQFREARVDGIFTPVATSMMIGHPAFDGVSDWGGGAVDPVRDTLTLNTMVMPFRIHLVARDSAEAKSDLARKAAGGENARAPSPYTQTGTPWIAVVQAWIGPFGAPCSAPPWGKISQVDLRTGKLTWEKVLGTARDTGLFGSHVGVPLKSGVPNLGGPITTAGGVVFIGATTDQYLRAFDARTGAELWKARLPAGAQATPMTYRGADGRQYVVITAGGHGALGTRYGDYTIAYALPKS